MLCFKDHSKGYIFFNLLMISLGTITMVTLYCRGLVDNITFILHIIGIGLSLVLFITIIIIYKIKLFTNQTLYENFYKYIQLGLPMFFLLTIFTWIYIYTLNNISTFYYIGILVYDILNTILHSLYIMLSPPFNSNVDTNQIYAA